MESQSEVREVGVVESRSCEGVDELELVSVANRGLDEMDCELCAALFESAEEHGVDEIVFSDEDVSKVEVCEVVP